jgi:hypothetical protein
MIKFICSLILTFITLSTASPYDTQSSMPVDWSINTIWSGSATLRQIDIDNHLKGINDDTFRVFTVQAAAPRMVLLFTDTSTALPMQWRCDTLEISPVGYYGACIGDVDRDGDNDLVYIRSATPYFLFRQYWNSTGSTWITETITSTTGGNWGMDVGDADNNGYTDDIIYSAGVTSSSRLNRAYWTGSAWQNSEIWSGDGRTIQGIAIGNFDSSNGDSNEIVVATAGSTTNGGRVMRIKWNGSIWDTMTMWKAPDNSSFTNVAIGNIDTTNLGNEVVVANGLGPGSMARGAIIEVYGSGTTWSQRPIFTPTASTNAWGLTVGDVMTTNPGDEVIFANSLGPPYEVRAVYGAGSNWSNELIYNIGGSSFGIVTGNVNKHRTLNQEIAIAGNGIVYEAEQQPSGGITVINTNQLTQSNIVIMPNPTKNILFVKYNGLLANPPHITLYNTAGRLVKCYTLNGFDQNQSYKIDVSSIPSGIYLMRLVSGEIKTTKVIVINR